VHGACGHVLSCQVVKVAASRDSMLGKNYPILEAPGWSDWMSGPVPDWRGRWIGQTGDEILPTHIYHNEETDGVHYSWV
jgi:hypothetical protein